MLKNTSFIYRVGIGVCVWCIELGLSWWCGCCSGWSVMCASHYIPNAILNQCGNHFCVSKQPTTPPPWRNPPFLLAYLNQLAPEQQYCDRIFNQFTFSWNSNIQRWLAVTWEMFPHDKKLEYHQANEFRCKYEKWQDEWAIWEMACSAFLDN